jgi:hypothetical protein
VSNLQWCCVGIKIQLHIYIYRKMIKKNVRWKMGRPRITLKLWRDWWCKHTYVIPFVRGECIYAIKHTLRPIVSYLSVGNLSFIYERNILKKSERYITIAYWVFFKLNERERLMCISFPFAQNILINVFYDRYAQFIFKHQNWYLTPCCGLEVHYPT